MPTGLINGVRLYWEDHGRGDVLLLIHGATQSSVNLAPHIAALSRSYRVIAPDLRAMGRSEHVSEMPPGAWPEDVGALMDHLAISRAHVYGVSLGARVALRLAVDKPALVRSLMLEMPIIAMEASTNQALNVSLGAFDDLPADQKRLRRDQHGEDWATVLANYMTIRNQPELQEYLNARETSKSIAVPTLIFRGDEREVVHPLDHCFELHRNISGSWLWIRPNTRSGVLEAAPEEAYAYMDALMATVQ
jgi:pimeloyl-ACP methyl ester carboxylesterase